MKEVPAGVFKNTCLKLIEEVHNTREEIIITKRGKQMVKIVPILPVESRGIYFGCMKGAITINCTDEELIYDESWAEAWEKNERNGNEDWWLKKNSGMDER